MGLVVDGDDMLLDGVAGRRKSAESADRARFGGSTVGTEIAVPGQATLVGVDVTTGIDADALLDGDAPGQAAGTGVVLEDGAPPTASPLPLDEETLPTAWVRGDVDAWLALAAAGEVRGLVIGGDAGFARELLDGLYGWLAL